jgi:hypothetical protein
MFSLRLIRTVVSAVMFSPAIAPAAIIMDWDASNWSGVSGDSWTDSVGGVVAVKGGGDGPVKSTVTLNGTSIDIINFTADSFDVNTTSYPLVGLKEFSISLLFSTSSAGVSTENNFYQWNGLVGKESGGAGVGDWAIGMMAGGLVAGGTGLGTGDTGTPSLASVTNTGFHNLTFVVANNGNNTFNQLLYLDGVLQNTDTNIGYGNPGAIAAFNFAIGARRDGSSGYSDSSIARLLFDDSALSASQVEQLHATHLGEAIPEPSSVALAILGTAGLIGLRRRHA